MRKTKRGPFFIKHHVKRLMLLLFMIVALIIFLCNITQSCVGGMGHGQL